MLEDLIFQTVSHFICITLTIICIVKMLLSICTYIKDTLFFFGGGVCPETVVIQKLLYSKVPYHNNTLPLGVNKFIEVD